MKFRTALNIPKSSITIGHNDHVFCVGSCFAQNMAERLANAKCSVLSNPLGILYNPVSIQHLLLRLASTNLFSEDELFQYNGLWQHWQTHSQFSGIDKSTVLKSMNAALQNARVFFQKTTRLVLTLGTSFVHQHLESQAIVANCHKVPAAAFQHFQLLPDAIVEELAPVLAALKKQLPTLEVIITVSPIRHIRLGLVDNQRSKAALLLATQQLCEAMDFVHYFPAYEFILDDLRDYRFYKQDMIHPNQQAIDYVWEQFSNHFFSDKTTALIAKIKTIQQASQHRPFNLASTQHQLFIKNTLQKMEKLENEYPFLEFSEERGRLT